MDDMKAFARLVHALRPWLDHLVIVGGWSHRLHRFHPLASPPTYLPLTTRDADMAFSEAAPLRGDMGEALRAADFREELSSDHTPPIAQYRLGQEEGGFYAEFLVPLSGDGLRRDGSPDATMGRAGITAQKLRYMELLLTSPWVARLGQEVGVELDPPADVVIANPVSFIAQKLLIRNERSPGKRAQDALYLHDTIELFGSNLDALREIWGALRPSLPERTARRIEAACEEQFGTMTDVIRAASRIPQDRSLRPERMQQVCDYGLRQIFGTI